MSAAIVRLFFLASLLSMLSACSTFEQVHALDPGTGYLPTGPNGPTVKADVTIDKKVDMSKYKGLLLVTGGDFIHQQVTTIGGFTEIMDIDDLEKHIITAGLQQQVPDIQGLIGMNNAYKYYKPFLWFHFFHKKDGNTDYAQFIVTDPGTGEDVFTTQKSFNVMWAGVNDQNTWYPLFNSYIDWLRENGLEIKAGPPVPGQHDAQQSSTLRH